MGEGKSLSVSLLGLSSIRLYASYTPEAPTQYQIKNKFHTYHTTKTIFDTGANRFIRFSSSRGGASGFRSGFGEEW